MKFKTNIFLILAIFSLLLFPVTGEKAAWLVRAGISANATGTYQSYLPAELHRASQPSSGQNLDLTLLGPDGNSRAFELFWRETTEPTSMVLASERVELLEDKRLMWEGKLPENYVLQNIKVHLPAYPEMAKVSIDGLASDTWETVESNLAVLKPAPHSRVGVVSVPISEKNFSRIRIYLTGLDDKFQMTPIQAMLVIIEGRRSGSNFFTKMHDLTFEEVAREENREIRIRMPGTGILVEKLEISTEAMFQGSWIIGSEKIVLGQGEFSSLSTGQIQGISKNPLTFNVPVNQVWKDGILILILRENNWSGAIKQVKASFRLPKIAFAADLVGNFQLLTGQNKSVAIAEMPAAQNRLLQAEITFAEAEFNSAQQAEDLLKNYAVGGGPFNADGYRWKAPIKIEKPGFYQLQISSAVALEDHLAGLRLVFDNQQVPYFVGRAQEREEPLNFNHEFNAADNQSIYQIRLPSGKNLPVYLKVKTAGIFSRSVTVENHEAGKVGWQPWKTLNWQNSEKMRLDIWHGDNSPISVSQALAHYQTQDLFFNAAVSGEYLVYGGNSSAKAPNYDISLIKNSMLKAEPQKVQMGEAAPHSETAIARQIEDAFSEKGIGLYLVLGLVTLVLIVLIVKMFPEEAPPEGGQNKTDKEN